MPLLSDTIVANNNVILEYFERFAKSLMGIMDHSPRCFRNKLRLLLYNPHIHTCIYIYHISRLSWHFPHSCSKKDRALYFQRYLYRLEYSSATSIKDVFWCFLPFEIDQSVQNRINYPYCWLVLVSFYKQF